MTRSTTRFVLVILSALIGAILMGACGPQTTTVGSQPVANTGQGQSTIPTPNPVAPGSDGTYAANYGLPAVTTVYVITGTIVDAPRSITGFEANGNSFYIDGTGSSQYAASTDGKSLIRFSVETVSYTDPYIDGGITKREDFAKIFGYDWSPAVRAEDVIILKAEDRKAAALGPGDHVTFMCREQFEYVMPVANNEIPTTQSVTREIDGCRMIDGRFKPITPGGQ